MTTPSAPFPAGPITARRRRRPSVDARRTATQNTSTRRLRRWRSPPSNPHPRRTRRLHPRTRGGARHRGHQRSACKVAPVVPGLVHRPTGAHRAVAPGGVRGGARRAPRASVGFDARGGAPVGFEAREGAPRAARGESLAVAARAGAAGADDHLERVTFRDGEVVVGGDAAAPASAGAARRVGDGGAAAAAAHREHLHGDQVVAEHGEGVVAREGVHGESALERHDAADSLHPALAGVEAGGSEARAARLRLSRRASVVHAPGAARRVRGRRRRARVRVNRRRARRHLGEARGRGCRRASAARVHLVALSVQWEPKHEELGAWGRADARPGRERRRHGRGVHLEIREGRSRRGAVFGVPAEKQTAARVGDPGVGVHAGPVEPPRGIPDVRVLELQDAVHEHARLARLHVPLRRGGTTGRSRVGRRASRRRGRSRGRARRPRIGTPASTRKSRRSPAAPRG